MQHPLAAVGERYHGVFHGRGQRAGDLDVAREKAGKGGGVGALAEDADVVGKADHSDGPVRGPDYAVCRIRRTADAGDVRRVGDRRSLRAGNTADAVKRARNALYARAEEGHGANGGTCERRTFDAVAVTREPDDARLRARGAEDTGAESGGDGRRVLHLAIDAHPVKRDAGSAGEIDGAALDARALRIAVLLDWPLGVGRDAGKSQHAHVRRIPDGTEGLDRNVVVVGVCQEAE
jgi:hypothetical protein